MVRMLCCLNEFLYFLLDWRLCRFLRAPLHPAEVQTCRKMYPPLYWTDVASIFFSLVFTKSFCVDHEHFSLIYLVAVEECTENGCLALSLLELLAFNMAFVFIASVLVLIEVTQPLHLSHTVIRSDVIGSLTITVIILRLGNAWHHHSLRVKYLNVVLCNAE